MTKLWFFSPNRPRLLKPGVRFIHSESIPMLANWIAALYLLWVITNWPQLQLMDLETFPAEPLSVNEQPAALDYLQIADWRLMGEGAEGVAQPVQTMASTPLPLKLSGTFFLAEQPHNHYAVIQSSDGAQHKYRVGEGLPEGATLQAVERSRVVLMHNQRLEYLEFAVNPVALSIPND